MSTRAFFDSLFDALNQTTTENGDKAYRSTRNACLDFFGLCGVRKFDATNLIARFNTAFLEDEELTLRIMFYLRDVRGGQGTRANFRTLLTRLADINPEFTATLIPLIPKYGRWDDMFVLADKPILWNAIVSFVRTQLEEDAKNEAEGKAISLLAKWMPSNNTSSEKSRKLADKFTKELGMTPRTYRKTLSKLRKQIGIVEQKMCKGEWSVIDYAKVPSKAAFMYRKAFRNHDEERYTQYLADVSQGKQKINAATLTPPEVVYKVLEGKETNPATVDALWNALPNYMEGQAFNGLVVADVSGSMSGYPMAISIGLALYLAQRNQGVWQNKFLTFSTTPELVTIPKSESIVKTINFISRANWDMSTDLRLLFFLILEAGRQHNISQEDMPSMLIIVSDMQFDRCCYGSNLSTFEYFKEQYAKAGYEIPQLVFWNARAVSSVPITQHETGTALVSGESPSIMPKLLNGSLTPLSLMRDTVMTERYDSVGNLVKEFGKILR
jgi:hypothetical protein